MMEKNSQVRIILQDMELQVRIGLYPHEQEGGRTQRIIVNAELYAAAGDYLRNVCPDTIIDYDRLYKGVRQWAERPHTLLIETYATELLDLCFQDRRITAARVSVTKPDIFEDVARAGVEIFMRREDWTKEKS